MNPSQSVLQLALIFFSLPSKYYIKPTHFIVSFACFLFKFFSLYRQCLPSAPNLSISQSIYRSTIHQLLLLYSFSSIYFFYPAGGNKYRSTYILHDTRHKILYFYERKLSTQKKEFSQTGPRFSRFYYHIAYTYVLLKAQLRQ